jgi:hypothetical protein
VNSPSDLIEQLLRDGMQIEASMEQLSTRLIQAITGGTR